MEPISLRKLDSFGIKDRRIINTGLLRDNTNIPEEELSNMYTVAKNYSRRSLLNYDGNSLFGGFGTSFYNPFLNKKHLYDLANSPTSPYYGYLLKSNRDVICIPVITMGTSVTSNYSLDNITLRDSFITSEYVTNPKIFGNYIGTDLTMDYSGIFLRSDGHYIMDPIDSYEHRSSHRQQSQSGYNISKKAKEEESTPYDIHVERYGVLDEDNILRADFNPEDPTDSTHKYRKENNASVLYYIPFYTRTMYDIMSSTDELFGSLFKTYLSKQNQQNSYFPSDYVNIIIGPSDITNMGQTYHALLDFEPYIKHQYDFNGEVNSVYVALRLATKKPLLANGFQPHNKVNRYNTTNYSENNYYEKCVYLNPWTSINEEKIQTPGFARTLYDGFRRFYYQVNTDPGTNVIYFMRVDFVGQPVDEHRYQDLVLDIEWRWGLRYAPFYSTDDFGINYKTNVLPDGILYHDGHYFTPFLEVKLTPYMGLDYYGVSNDISGFPEFVIK